MKAISNADNKVISGCKIVEVETEEFGHKVWIKGLWIPYNELRMEISYTEEQIKKMMPFLNKEAKAVLRAKADILKLLLNTYIELKPDHPIV